MFTHSKKTILIVEDDAVLLKVLAEKVTSAGFNVITSNDGEKGLATARTEHPDLILLDIILPIMDGITMMHTLRKENDWGKMVPIILLTNLAGDDDKIVKAIAEDEPSYYLVKSNTGLDAVIEKIQAILGA
ncbi:MAG: response regulator [Patescibacteria group bacterium]|nr:response regulator [Patescibacteria group bacterium]MDE2438606.1 response regulator [Patescibacteria group bacterium]